MTRFRVFSSSKLALVALLSFSLVVSPTAFAKSPVKMKNFIGSIDLSAEDPVPFSLAGTASHLGKFTAEGEVEFIPRCPTGSPHHPQ